jgi:hypothetical protein
MDIDSEMIHSPLLAVQREIYIILVDPVSLVDMSRDITVEHKILA